MNDCIVRAMSASGGIRLLTCRVTRLAQQVCDLQQASATVSIALGRGLAGAGLMGALLKAGQRVALKFEGNGPMGKMIVEADSDGAVRGCAGVPSAEAEPVDGRWNVPGVLGRAGFLTVTRDLGLGGEPYQGLVQLMTSEIGDDLAYYLTDSEQVPSAVGLGVALDGQAAIVEAGGFLVQALPKADDAEIGALLERIGTLPPLTELLRDGGPELLVRELFGDLPYNMLETRELFFRCGCTREKVERALLSLGAAELGEMLDQDNGAQVACEFCKQGYQFEPAELKALIGMATAAPGEGPPRAAH